MALDGMKQRGPYKTRTVTQMTGFAPPLLRSWERRYDLLHPLRGPGGHRLYTGEDLKVVLTAKELLSVGRSIGEIAGFGREALLEEDARVAKRGVTNDQPPDPDDDSTEAIGQPQPGMLSPALSPDGQRVAVWSNESGNPDIWIHDLVRSTKTRLTFDEGAELNPMWSPSGGEIAYSLSRNPEWRLMSKTADGTGEAVVLVEGDHRLSANDWSTDGRYLVYSELIPEASDDIRYVELQSDGEATEPVTFLGTPASERGAELSPDGRFAAYHSSESGSLEIYVGPFPDGAGKWQVSVNGGRQPRWRSDGKELYYLEGTGSAMMAVSVSTEPTFTPGQPQRLFESMDLVAGPSAATYDVSADGQRFITVAPVEADGEETAPPKIRIVENWYEEFRDREQ